MQQQIYFTTKYLHNIRAKRGRERQNERWEIMDNWKYKSGVQ